MGTATDGPVTLRELLEQNPEWADLDIAIFNSNGLDFVGCSGQVFVIDADDGKKALVFSAN